MSIIRTIRNPEITLRNFTVDKNSELYYEESDRSTGVFIKNKNIEWDKRAGLFNFFILVNGILINPNDIEICSLDFTKKYPKLSMRIKPNFDEFVNFGLPKDGDIISLFYRSTLEDLKPLRIDYILTDIKNEIDLSFVIHGVINIPKLFKDTSFFSDKNSLETMLEISKELKLGFATNESKTNDEQGWLCANQPLDVFMKDVTEHSWKDDRSFFDSFIDPYYNLNFINVFSQLNNEKEKRVNQGLFKFRQLIQTNKETIFNYDEENLEYTKPLVLHNWMYNPIEETKISTLGFINESTRISLEQGYQKFLHFYDYSLDEKIELINEAITSFGVSEDLLPLKGNLFDENWRQNTRHSWSGISYSLPDHNVHSLYYQAQAHNQHNLKEIDKFSVVATLNQVNFNLHRYMIIPVLWYEYGEIAKKLREIGKQWNAFTPNESVTAPYPYVINMFISGFYVLKGFHIDFVGPSEGNPPIVSQRLILSRTEWPKSFIVTDSENKPVTNLS